MADLKALSDAVIKGDQGTAATVETRDFWRTQEQFGGNSQGNHWHANGESYWLIGEAMGKAMVRLSNNDR